MRRFLVLAACALVAAPVVRAGPPLFSDDPVVVEPGHVQLISAVAGSERGPNDSLGVTLLDVALGVLPRLELDLTAEFAKDETNEDVSREEDGFVLTGGIKWEPIRSEHFSLAVAPAISVQTNGDNLAGSIPLLLEWRVGRFRTVASGVYLPARSASDGWQAGIFAGLGIGEGSELLAEVYSQAFEDRADPEVGWNAGFDLELTKRVHLLGSAGTGIYGGEGKRRNWTAYGGLQLLLGPIGGAGGPPDEVAPLEPASLAAARLLELTDRQFSRPR